MTSNLPAVVVPLNELERMGERIAKSGLFGVKTADQAIALMLVAQAEGLHPAIAARDFHVIQGRPSLKADAMLARFQAAGGRVRWTSYTDQKVSGVFSHAAGGDIEVDWTMDRAKTAGLAGKDNWKNYPRAMLRSRVISEGIRTVYPGVVAGFYTPEENADIDEPKRQPPRDITPKPRATQADRLADFAGNPDKPSTAGTAGSVEETPPAAETVDSETGEIRTPVPTLDVPGAEAPVGQWQKYRDALLAAVKTAPDKAWLDAFQEYNHDGMAALDADFPKAAKILRDQIAGRATEMGA